jgi:regulator of nucleoside diphosphate kinase
MIENTITMTLTDHAQLTALIEARRHKKNELDAPAFDMLAHELARAKLVAPEDIPMNVATMNSLVLVRDLDSGKTLTVTLSWPEEADSARSRINVLAPLGMALLGLRVGQQIEWPVPEGIRKLSIENVFQPENND